MSIKEHIYKDRILFFIIFLIVTVFLLIETEIKKKDLYNEKIYDLKVQYENRLISFSYNMEDLFVSIITDEIKELVAKVQDTTNEKEIFLLREKLKNKVEKNYEFLKSRGIKLFHFHLPNGNSFLRMHKPSRYGDNLLSFRETVKKVIETKKPVIDFEAGKFFDGFRYLFPIFYKDKFVGSVELSLSSQTFIKSLNRSMDSKFFMIMTKKYIDAVLTKEHVKKNFHSSCINRNYYITNKTDNIESKILNDFFYEHVRNELLEKIESQESFIHTELRSLSKSDIYVFYSLKDIDNRHIGYIIAIKESSILNKLYFEFVTLLISAFLIIFIIYHFNEKQLNRKVELDQFINFLDETALISKIDQFGKITYINKKFSEISAFDRGELLGQRYEELRHLSTNNSAFKDMWNHMSKGKKWHGTLTNKTKEGNAYTISIDIFPIFDSKNRLKEYISISHDITELETLRKELVRNVEEKSGLIDQYENAIKNSSLLMKVGKNLKITSINDYYLQELGYEKDEIINHNSLDFIYIENAEEVLENMLPTIKKGKSYRGVLNILKKDESLMHINLYVRPILNIDGEIQEFISIGTDITELIDLTKEIEETQKEVVFQMGAIGETRSKETGNHVKRVAEYSKLLAILYGMEKEEAELIKQASPMHDIGKVGIPDSILNKPARFTDEEFKIMKTHSQIGYDMLKHSNRPILKTASIIAYEHHEKWNGRGYPRGIKGEEIHIYGRITALADVFDALGSDRVYKKAWELDRILKLIEEERGEHFDPKLVDLFLDNLDKFLLVRDRFKDVV